MGALPLECQWNAAIGGGDEGAGKEQRRAGASGGADQGALQPREQGAHGSRHRLGLPANVLSSGGMISDLGFGMEIWVRRGIQGLVPLIRKQEMCDLK